MQHEPKISVIILNWNGWTKTLRCLEYLQNITYLNYNVILLDNGSTDDSVQHLTRVINGKKEFSLLRNETNEGFTGGMNKAIEYVLQTNKSEYIFLLNNDALVEKDCLNECIRIVKSESYDIVGALSKSLDEKQVLFAGANPERELFYGYTPPPEIALHDTWETGRVEGSGVLISSVLLKEIHSTYNYIFDPRLFFYGDDIDFAMIAKKLGKKIVMSKKAIIYHEIAQSGGGSANPLQYYYITRNRILLANKWLSSWKRLAFHFYYPLSRLLRALQRFIEGNNKAASAIINGVVDGYLGKYGKWKKHWN